MLTWEKMINEKYNLIYNNKEKIASIKAKYNSEIKSMTWVCIYNNTEIILKSNSLRKAQKEAMNIIKEMIPEEIKEEVNKRKKIWRRIKERVVKKNL